MTCSFTDEYRYANIMAMMERLAGVLAQICARVIFRVRLFPPHERRAAPVIRRTFEAAFP
ncbi:hypothetical protein NXT3_CH03358 [Sinorhizobium fredii]|uniref:Uncharacterized protein n=1 Tax=Rhizobium fredii TaxID=380 RepID=A0A2L0H8U5_RHIFR|nr:hypothetical protein NXT3_CH03358 [Sinorhizobium fredii]